jgi:DNA-binding NarL/FixJ family response regulator
VILSNLGQKTEIDKGIQLGADKYFVKAHYTPTQIVEEIKKILA